MKKIIITLTNLLIFTFIFAQTPNQFKYQAVLRDANGNIIANQSKNIVIEILQNDLSTSIFTENHEVTTTAQGLININIGSVEDLSDIDWSSDEYFIQITVDDQIMGTIQLLSVPYAIQSKNVENVDYSQISGTPDLSEFITNETDPVFSAWDKTTGILITESQISDLGNYFETENQNLNDVLTISNSAGNKNITELANPVNDQDAATKEYVDLLEERILELEGQIYGTIDIDGNFYRGVKIGNQIWLAENLKTTKYSDGTSIANVTDNNVWTALSTPAYAWYNNDYENNGSVYGALYNWYTVDAANNGGKSICPTGWHMPSDDEWETLINYLGGNDVAGGKMKESGITHWALPNTGATNESQFTALPAGMRFQSGGGFLDYLVETDFWGANSVDSDMATVIVLEYDNSYCYRVSSFKKNGYSVRCIKD